MSSGPTQFLAEVFRDKALEGSDLQPVCVSLVDIVGGDNFQRQFFAKLLGPLATQSDYTLSELVRRVEESQTAMGKTGVFSSIQPSLHVDYLHKSPAVKLYNKDAPILTKVVFDLQSQDASVGNVALGFNTEDNLLVDMGYVNNNFNGNAEDVRIGVHYRPYRPLEHLASGARLELSLRNPSYRFVLDLANRHDNNQAWQHCLSRATEGLIGIQYGNLLRTLQVFGGLSLTKRSVYDLADGRLQSVAASSGEFLKSAMLASLLYKNLVTVGAFPASGVSFDARGEVASDQKDEKPSSFYSKIAVAANYYKSWAGLTVHAFGEGGVIGLGEGNVHISDRFYLGGFGSFSGFARGLVDAEGGLLYQKCGATIYGPLPLAAKNQLNPLRLYATSQVGSVGTSGGVASSGVGLRFFSDWVTLDAGYLVSGRFDGGEHGVRDGFQMEVSLGGARNTR